MRSPNGTTCRCQRQPPMTAANATSILRDLFCQSSFMEINPIKSEITALRARFDAARGYL